jgi:nitroimidazol reductase NimA-like FMN-containing flavoprotein (pyridoxamine 5'-phosphate oxidase superfamily)
VSVDGPMLARDEADFVARHRVGYLATVYPDGRPHVVPISPVLDLDRLVFATEVDTQKVRNLGANPSAAIAFDEYDEDWSKLRQIVVHGGTYVIDSGFEFERDRTLLYEKYPQYEAEAPIIEGESLIVEVRIDRVVTWGF